jgi:hypothetical protein
MGCDNPDQSTANATVQMPVSAYQLHLPVVGFNYPDYSCQSKYWVATMWQKYRKIPLQITDAADKNILATEISRIKYPTFMADSVYLGISTIHSGIDLCKILP